MKLLLYLFGVTFHSNTVVALELRECSHQLGMSNRKIRDEQISASSSFDLQSTGPQHARAHQESGSGAWCPKNQINSLSKEWLQISFSVDTVITSVETQGRFDDGRGMEYATAFKIQYWRPSLNAWASYKDDFELETIPANNDTEHAIRRHLDRAIIARRIRIVPVSNSTRTVCMRVEVFGCPFDDSLVFYNVDQGDLQSGISYHDFSYDGNLANSPHLTGGIGKLYDGEVGKNNVFVNHHKWVGWRRKRNGNVKLAFEFSELRNISGILIHTSNEFKKSAKAFSSATVLFSINGKDFSDTIVHFNNPEDTESEVPRWIRIPVNNRIAKVAKIRLNFGTDSDWLFISEVNFESNHTNIELLNDDVVIPDSVSYFSVTEHDDGTSMFAFIIFFFMFLIVAVIILTVLYRKREYRVKASSPSPNAKREILLTIDGNTIKHHVSPSTYQMARDNLQNALIEKMPMSPIISDYAEPDISVCSDVTANTPLLYGIDGPYDTQKRSNPLSSMVKYSDYGEVYCTTLPEIARDKLICVSRIGQGEFGEVDLCQLENRKVAVKKLHGISQADEFSFHREIRVLGSLKHPNVVEVVGVCTIQKPILCIMEYMENGDLKSYILKNPTIQTSQCISICTQLAAGLAYLESCNFVHSATSEKSLKSAATSNFSLISDKSERGSSSEKVQRRDRNSTIDSLKVPRRPPQASSMSSSGKSYRKSGNQVSVRGSQKSDTTDSAKTELIEMPLGKAARDEPKHNILTPAAEQKTGDSSPPSKRVQFAHPLKRVKRRATMPPEDADEKTMYIA